MQRRPEQVHERGRLCTGVPMARGTATVAMPPLLDRFDTYEWGSNATGHGLAVAPAVLAATLHRAPAAEGHGDSASHGAVAMPGAHAKIPTT